MSRFVRLYPEDVPESVWLLHHEAASGRIEVRPEYQQLCCPSCKKLDEHKALSLGLSRSNMSIRVKKDFIAAEDGPCIVSTRLRDLIQTIEGADVSFVQISRAEKYWVAMPNIIYHPTPGDPAFREMSRQCPRCSRWREVVWGSVPPSVDRECQICMFQLENRQGMMSAWVVAESVATFLQKQTPKLKGLLFDKPFSQLQEVGLRLLERKYEGYR